MTGFPVQIHRLSIGKWLLDMIYFVPFFEKRKVKGIAIEGNDPFVSLQECCQCSQKFCFLFRFFSKKKLNRDAVTLVRRQIRTANTVNKMPRSGQTVVSISSRSVSAVRKVRMESASSAHEKIVCFVIILSSFSCSFVFIPIHYSLSGIFFNTKEKLHGF